MQLAQHAAKQNSMCYCPLMLNSEYIRGMHDLMTRLLCILL